MREVLRLCASRVFRRLRGRADRGRREMLPAFSGASRCNHQRMFASRRYMPGFDWTAVGCLKARRNQSRVAGETRPAGAMKGLDYLPLTLFP